jgi:MFS family permease
MDESGCPTGAFWQQVDKLALQVSEFKTHSKYLGEIMTETMTRTRSPWATFTVCAIASYISTLDMSIVNVAFFEIHKSFPNDSASTISWVVTAYSILFGSLLVVSGRLADQAGRKKFFLIGTSFFLAGSLFCALASTMGLLIAGRAIQGIGGAMMTPASTGLLLGVFPAEKRGQVMAWTGSIGALGVASGPTLGAFFVSSFGWRSAFWINVPIMASHKRIGKTKEHSSRHLCCDCLHFGYCITCLGNFSV